MEGRVSVIQYVDVWNVDTEACLETENDSDASSTKLLEF